MLGKYLIERNDIAVEEQVGYQKRGIYKNANVFVFEVWDVQKVDARSSRGIRQVYEEYESEPAAIQRSKAWDSAIG